MPLCELTFDITMIHYCFEYVTVSRGQSVIAGRDYLKFHRLNICKNHLLSTTQSWNSTWVVMRTRSSGERETFYLLLRRKTTWKALLPEELVRWHRWVLPTSDVLQCGLIRTGPGCLIVPQYLRIPHPATIRESHNEELSICLFVYYRRFLK